MSDLKDLLPRVVEIAKQAGDAIMAIYNNDEDFETTYKDDRSPLTKADLLSNEIIVKGLQELAPEIPILSEESKQTPYPERSGWSRFWLVDPIDGTKEFIKRNGEFTVNIALVDSGQPVLGVVHAPARTTTYWGAEGEGAFQQNGGGVAEPMQVTQTHAGLEAIAVVASRSHAGPETVAFLDRLEAANGAIAKVSAGSSLKLCLVASGEAQLYPRFGPTMEWDTAAAHAVVVQAGGAVTNMEGVALRYNKENLLNPFFVVSDGSGLDWKACLE
ncbi:3'(2'),5'-bisphosphate nucleotidase CysQ [Synechococcus sp. PCC 7336]|uniref:3'(2'),5'-bisphosphate nucleotidase CysQ n=1 Tax=Synechococcus sp. PCC 7336 TaxID=195250 RepID=UPI001930B155|nr:3'(2'),5'-bisphosphate nucleotidase CysQ [Synechococcus sp. PCC 7336]